ncbi:MAG: hypothetical protein ABI390_01925 [Daejeonella sp.]
MANQSNSNDGLNNLGSIKPESGGSLYKSKRNFEKETIYKVFPVSINQEDSSDPAFKWYKKESVKLKRLSNASSGNFENIISVGLSEKDSFPYVEAEFVDGLSLKELTATPYAPILDIAQILKLTSQLAVVLNTIHKQEVAHMQINSANIRHLIKSGKFILTGFGSNLIIPEEKTGKSSTQPVDDPYQKDICDLATLLYFLLSGEPFSGEKFKNDNAFADNIVESRKKHLPSDWSEDKKKSELEIPVWLIDIIRISLQLDKKLSFINGFELNLAVAPHTNLIANKEKELPAEVPVAAGAVLPKTTAETADKEQEISKLKAILAQKEGQINVYKYQSAEFARKQKFMLSPAAMISLAVIFLLLLGFAAYSLFFNKSDRNLSASTYSGTDTATEVKPQTYQTADSVALLDSITKSLDKGIDSIINKYKTDGSAEVEEPVKETPKKAIVKKAPPKKTVEKPKSAPKPAPAIKNPPVVENKKKEEKEESPENTYVKSVKYSVAVAKAYFYDEPDVRTRRPLYLAADTGSSDLTASQESNGFIYVVFFNTEGEITKGWLRKVDLRVSY